MILVTGATGTVGGAVARQLIDAGQPTRLFVRDRRKLADLAGKAEVAVGNLDKPDTFEAALNGVDGVFLVTLGSGEQDMAAAAAARRAGVKRFVKLSTSEAEDATGQIGRSHRAREQMIESSGVPWTFLRPGQFMSNSLRWADTIRSEGAVYFPNGSDQVGPVDPCDLAAVAVAALTQPGHVGQAYTLTGPALVTVSQQVQIIARLLGRPLTYVDVPLEEAKGWLVKGGMPASFVDAMVELMWSLRRGEGAFITDTVQRLLGRPPRSYESWVSAHLAAFQ